MPIRIDASAPNLRASFADDVRPSGAGAMGAAFGNLAQDMAQVGLRLQNERIQETEERERKADAVYLARAGADARIAWAKQLDDDVANYDGSAPGLADGYLQRYGKDAEARVAAAPERVRAALQIELIRQGEVLGGAALEAESGKRSAWTLNGINEAADVQAEALVTQPDLYFDAVDSLPAIIAAAPEGLRAGLEKEKLAQFATAYAEGLLTKDPARLVEELNAGMLDPSLDPKAKAAWLKTAQGEVDQRATQARLEAERAQRELEQRSGKLSGRAVAYINAGLPVPKELMRDALAAATEAASPEDAEAIRLAQYKANKESVTATRTEAKGVLEDLGNALALGLEPSQQMVDDAARLVASSKSPDLVRELQTMAALAGKQRAFAFMTPEDLGTREAELRAMPATRESTKELELLMAVSGNRDKAVADGALPDWVASNGVALKPLQANDPNLADAVAQRARTMAAMAAQAGAPFQFFGKHERTSFARQLEQLPPDQRLAVLGTMAGELGPDAMTVFGEISKEAGRDAQAGWLLMMGRNKAAGDVVNGAAAIRQAPKLAPDRTKGDALAAESSVIGPAIHADNQNERGAVLDAAAALYAVEMQRRGTPDGEFNKSVYEEALQTAGGRDDGGRGGFGVVNGHRLTLPPHMTQQDVQALVSSGQVFGPDVYRYSYGDPAEGKPGGPPAWRNTATGELVRFAPEQLKSAKLVTVSPGLYRVSVTDPAAGAQYVRDLDTGEPFILDLRFASASAPARPRADPIRK